MTSIKKDFYGKEVTDAIRKACEELGVPQEQLDIEVVETGSTGIFGLIRKKARIRAQVKEVQPDSRETEDKPAEEEAVRLEAPPEEVHPEAPEEAGIEETQGEVPEDTAAVSAAEEETAPEEETTVEDDTPVDDDEDDLGNGDEAAEELPNEVLELIKNDLAQLLDLMGYSSPVEVSAKGTSVFCHVGEEFEAALTGQDGKTLDSIQYLLRKIVARKVPHRLRLTVDVGNYREKRLGELKERAIDLAEKVKTNGKTQVIPALSPSERRVIHMSLQDDKEIRSRSVGDGLFKKILIYKPGKGSGKSGGRRRGPSRGRKGQNSRKKSD